MSKRTILIQLDTDPQPSTFDGVVAVDAGVEVLLRHGGVTPDNVQALVYGAIFTRGMDDLKSTALFIGGSDVAAGEAVLAKIRKTFFGPMRVSVLMDSNGANTTAAAAVLAALKHVKPAEAATTVLGGTGPVGQRAARLLAAAGAEVRVGSRSQERAAAVCREISAKNSAARLTPIAAGTPAEIAQALSGCQAVIAAGAAGAQIVPAEMLDSAPSIKLAIDLNAVPPLGIAGIEPTDKAKDRGGVVCYGALGVGGTKMKIHRAAVAKLFERNDLLLDAEEILEIGRAL
jgi:hypothetical protein